MSELLVEICKVKEVAPHPNADRLDLIVIKGWSVVVQKNLLKQGDLVVFIPPDSVLPQTLHEHLGITKYCAELPKDQDGNRPTERRIKAARIRGVVSYGTIMTLESFVDYIYDTHNETYDQIRLMHCDEGNNVADLLGITKWNPPIKSTQGDVEKDCPAFIKYTDIENWRNYPNIFQDGEQIRITEKIHGTNCRLGYLRDTGMINPEFVAGSHKTRRKELDQRDNKCLYWQPFEWYPALKIVLQDIYAGWNETEPIIIYGEIYGSKVQDLNYGFENGKKDFRMFDISIGGKYTSWKFIQTVCNINNIPTVPFLYEGPYSAEIVEQYTNGPTVVCSNPGKFRGREGIVITPLKEREDPLIGRVILKSINPDYLARGK